VPEVELSAGVIEYEDTNGDGPPLVLLHGVTIDSSVWQPVVENLGSEYRCVTPTLPLGSHRHPMNPDADLTIRGVALLVAEFLERLGLEDVTLVINDWGGALALVAEGRTERIGRLVVTSCEAFDNFPPGLGGHMLELSGRLPGGLYVAFQLLRLRLMRRQPGGWGWMTKRPLPRELMDRWFEPGQKQRGVRRDLRKFCVSVPPKKTLAEWAEALRSFDRPALVAWASEDRLMPPEHGRRIAEMLPQGRLVEIEDSYTLIPQDQPAALSDAIRKFLVEAPAAA